MNNSIIALSGPRTCGKSTIANHLVNEHGYTRIAFADALRQIASLVGEEWIDDRMYLANLGQQLRNLLPDFLLQVVQRRIGSIKGPVVIEDVRFPAEVEFCRSIGAQTIRLEIPLEIQLERLFERDGMVGEEATILVECMDEFAIPDTTEWDMVVPAIGDFSELAKHLHDLVSTTVQPSFSEVVF